MSDSGQAESLGDRVNRRFDPILEKQKSANLLIIVGLVFAALSIVAVFLFSLRLVAPGQIKDVLQDVRATLQNRPE